MDVNKEELEEAFEELKEQVSKMKKIPSSIR